MRIELIKTGHIQVRLDKKDGIPHRYVVNPDSDDIFRKFDDDIIPLAEKCIIIDNDKIIPNANVQEYIDTWRKTPEIKQAIEGYKNETTGLI